MPLRLKSLHLHGYKTFASPTVFEFAGGITVIVGPNGSGKSNIADALRWVLGEQSYSLLRGKKTEDMIFSGSEHRPRAGMASVEVLFDNSSGWLPLDFAEISLARRAYRDGRNEYLLNGQHVRLRDLNELLAASGLSERTYTILGQGLVDASLALKAEERRRLFEEAAGVGLYRVRREEAIRRLETTQRNLERVQDILTELEPRLKHLERQARRAAEYAAAQADLRLLLREWYGYHWHRAQHEMTEARQAVRAQEERVAEARQAHLRAQADANTFREHLSHLRTQLNAWHRQAAALHSQREGISRDLAVLDERQRALRLSQTALLAEQERAAHEEQLLHQRLETAAHEASRLQAEFDEATSQLGAARQLLHTRQAERADLEEKLRAAHGALNTFQTRQAETQARLDELATRFKAQKQKLETLQQTIQAAESEVHSLQQAYLSAQEARRQAEKAWKEVQAAVAGQEKEIEALEKTRQATLEERSRLQAEHSRLKAQLEVLEQAEQSLAGYAEGARFLLDAARRSQLQTRGALSAMLDVPPELETAIAAALGDALDAVLLESHQIEEALRLLEADEAGRAALLPLDGQGRRLQPPTQEADCLGLASELVRVPAELRGVVDLLLGQTLIARHRSAAQRLRRTLPPQARVVTLRGEVFRGDGLILAGKPASSSTLSRPRQKRELTASVDNLADRLHAIEDALETLATQQASARREQESRQEQLHQAHRQLEEAVALEQRLSLDLEAARRQLDWQKSQRDEWQKEMSEAEAARQRLSAEGAEQEKQTAQAGEQLQALTELLNQIRLDEAQEQVAYWNTRLAVVQQSLAEAQARMAEHGRAIEERASQQQELQARLAEVERQLQEAGQRKEALQQQETLLHAQIEGLQAHIAPAERDLESAEQEEKRLQEQEAEAQRLLAAAERALGQMQLDFAKRQAALDSLRERILDDFGLVSFEYAPSVEGPMPLPFEGLVEQLPRVTELPPDLEENLAHQRARLRRMGPINPEAKKEYEAESERYTFMTTQLQDLHQAGAHLRQVIAELDDLTRREFLKTYEAVDKQFRAIFTRLFGGGSARLSLTDPDNLVETGIEIEARLPGRREQGLSLLSGGERSLTAIALVFALLKVSPTPVCVMDEVDAMLDEANVGRFRDLLMELSKDTQFIVITHNRSTVQAADVIYGVTMGRDSTSQVISLRLDEVSEEMLGNAAPN